MEEDLATDLLVLQSHLDSMLECVKKNSTMLRKFQSFEMRLLSLNSLADIIDHILEDAKDYFDLDVISLCLFDEHSEIVKLLTDDGYDYPGKEGLILLQSKRFLKSPYAIRSYIGTYKTKDFTDFFPPHEKVPASVAITPLNRHGKYLGTLNLGSYQATRFSSTMATDFVEHLGSIVSVCLENNLNLETIRRTSLMDTLTGVNNRRFFEQRIGEELDRSQRNNEPVTCLFLDIDFFKSVNDQHGHQGGDLVLSLVANTIKTQLRNNDVLARYGGEEFVALLSNIDIPMGIEIAERIRKAVQELTIEFSDIAISVTISIGLSTYLPGKNALISTEKIASLLIKSADSALYRAKHNGRNRVENNGIISE